jgi:hypothetical protein
VRPWTSRGGGDRGGGPGLRSTAVNIFGGHKSLGKAEFRLVFSPLFLGEDPRRNSSEIVGPFVSSCFPRHLKMFTAVDCGPPGQPAEFRASASPSRVTGDVGMVTFSRFFPGPLTEGVRYEAVTRQGGGATGGGGGSGGGSGDSGRLIR